MHVPSASPSPPPMSLAVFPFELVDAVLRFLEPKDLASVARTSASIYPVALRSLYCNLSVADSPVPAYAPPSVVRTLAARPDVAAHVRYFSVSLDDSASLSPEFSRQLASALSAMTALISLDIFIDETGSWVLPDRLVSPQLRHFASSFPFDSRVATFCGNAPALASVQLGCTGIDVPPLANACMPRLAEFTGCLSAAVALVPGRPVESVFVTSGDFTEDLVPELAKSTSLVTVLSISTNSAPVSFLQVLGQHLPHIAYLRITSTCNLPAPPTTIFYEQVAGALAFFPNLQSFELSGMSWSSYKQPDDQKRVWQSQPLNNELDPEETVDLYSNTADFDFFFS
ncbi:hypothetical protein GGX14DRAFT_415528 [Mycena pura]|uniref:F-box domain-containing protein n=1 Tax=Mycena pura TaxID=153505 RepID=A0AAD6YTB7_9AGAR|nr:hypothetical protein GGX14DRAFT_415528 [Mycena pura]